MFSFDNKTFGIIVFMCLGLLANIVLYELKILPIIPAVILATFFMNLSFTAWHECAHGIFSSSNKFNQIFGWVTSFFSVYPGFYARKREHLLHHKYEGQPDKDPVYPRVQSSAFSFLFKAARTVIYHNSQAYEDLPLSRKEKVLDASLYCSVLCVLVAGYLFGFLYNLLLLWIFPRLLIFPIHAYYICYFPHHRGGKGYQVSRIVSTNWLVRFLTVNQSYHGIHHLWPSIPWHQYGSVYKKKKGELVQKGVEV